MEIQIAVHEKIFSLVRSVEAYNFYDNIITIVQSHFIQNVKISVLKWHFPKIDTKYLCDEPEGK